MCTSLAFKTNDFYFGRNMDLDYHFGEGITVTPRGYELTLRHEMPRRVKYAIVGMATVQDGYPLYAEGANERGLCISALSFEGNAHYGEVKVGRINLASFEIIPFILSSCESIEEARSYLKNIQITSTPFSEQIAPSPLHWHIADRNGSIVLESTSDGIKIYDNPYGALTNNPTFDFHLKNLSLYSHLKPEQPSDTAPSLGLSLLGLPGDFSSPSRLIRLVTLKRLVKCENDEKSSLATLFRLMLSVAPMRGTTLTKKGREHYTTYTCIINATRGIYYYTTPMSLEIKSLNLKDYAQNKSLFFLPL